MELSRIRTSYAQGSDTNFGSNCLFGCAIYCPRTNINLSHGFEAPSKSPWFEGGYFKRGLCLRGRQLGLELDLKDTNNRVDNVGRRVTMYVKLSSLKPNLVLGEDVKLSQKVEVSGNLC